MRSVARPLNGGYASCWAALVSGDVTNGVWRCDLQLNQGLERGTYAFDVTLTGLAGNTTTIPMLSSFESDDEVPPVMTDNSVTPSSVDVTYGHQVVTVTVSANDPAGLAPPLIRLVDPAHLENGNYAFCWASLATGDVTAGLWSCQLDIGSMPSATYAFRIELTDLAGNVAPTQNGTQLIVHNGNAP
jgi:hypothetical protein